MELLDHAAYGQLYYYNIDVVKLLTLDLDKGCDPSCRRVDRNTPLHIAATGGH